MTSLNILPSVRIAEHAPQALRELKGWLTWRFEEQPEGTGKPRKIPFYTNGGRRHGVQGRPQDRNQLTTFEAARASATRRGFDGVGLALMPEFNIVAGDFDNCVTDGVIHPQVEAIVSTTYSEFSPSGNGLRAFWRGDLGNQKSIGLGQPFGFEAFSSKGFVTFTGNILPGYDLVGLDDVIADVPHELIELAAKRFGKHSVAEDANDQLRVKARFGLSTEQLEQALDVLDPDAPYLNSEALNWLGVGMALHHETESEGFELWNTWSAKGSKYPGEAALQKKWESFSNGSPHPTTAGSLIKWVQAAGAQIEGVTNAAVDDFDEILLEPNAPAPLPAFERDKQGEIFATKENIMLAVQRPDICGVDLRHDEFRDEIMLAAPGTDGWRSFQDTDYTRVCLALERGRSGFKDISKEKIRDVVAYVADAKRFDSAQHWLGQQVWDGVPRVKRSLISYFGAEDTAYTQAVGLYLWTALAGRVLQPGIKADMVPVAVGEQGNGKSTTVAAISPSPEFFQELDLSGKDDDLARLMRGKLIIELGELKGLRTREVEHLKSFITRTHESWVPKFKEMAVHYPRRCVFFGTTNKNEFLADDTGHRRWLPFEAGQCDEQGMVRDRGQLWSEGCELFLARNVLWQDAERLAGAEHDKFVVHDAWEERVEDWLTKRGDFDQGCPGGRPFTAVEALVGAVGLSSQNLNQSHKDRMARVLKELGYKPDRAYINGKRSRAYVKDE